MGDSYDSNGIISMVKSIWYDLKEDIYRVIWDKCICIDVITVSLNESSTYAMCEYVHIEVM